MKTWKLCQGMRHDIVSAVSRMLSNSKISKLHVTQHARTHIQIPRCNVVNDRAARMISLLVASCSMCELMSWVHHKVANRWDNWRGRSFCVLSLLPLPILWMLLLFIYPAIVQPSILSLRRLLFRFTLSNITFSYTFRFLPLHFQRLLPMQHINNHLSKQIILAPHSRESKLTHRPHRTVLPVPIQVE